MPKLAVGGLKLSPELVQIRLHPRSSRIVDAMLRRLTGRQINLTGVTFENLEGQPEVRCVLLAEDRQAAEEALQEFKGSFAVQPKVGTLTIYPHQARMELIGDILSVLGGEKLPIYDIASSFSSLIITTDYDRLDDAVQAVSQIISLPENHAPFRPEFRVKQL
jgi:hypothetical protein